MPPEILALGDKFGAAGAATVMVTVASVVAPSLSVTRNVTTVEPSGRERVALVPVATTEPSTNHCVLKTLPSLSEAPPLKLTGSPETPSESATLWLPPEILALGDKFSGCAGDGSLTEELTEIAIGVPE